MRKASLVVLAIYVFLLTACTRTGRLYDLATGEVTPVTYTENGMGKGKITATLKTGEKLAGEYSTVPNGVMTWGTVYGSVYGTGGSASGNATSTGGAMSGAQRGEAIATGDKGTVLTCEYIVSAWSGHGSGACKHNHDKKYKLMF